MRPSVCTGLRFPKLAVRQKWRKTKHEVTFSIFILFIHLQYSFSKIDKGTVVLNHELPLALKMKNPNYSNCHGFHSRITNENFRDLAKLTCKSV